jgi:hypothetical protein
MIKKDKPKTRWGCIIAAIIVVLLIGGGGYLFYSYLYPNLLGQRQKQNEYTPPALNKEGKAKVQNVKDYGQPIQDNEPAGRADPFAPI